MRLAYRVLERIGLGGTDGMAGSIAELETQDRGRQVRFPLVQRNERTECFQRDLDWKGVIGGQCIAHVAERIFPDKFDLGKALAAQLARFGLLACTPDRQLETLFQRSGRCIGAITVVSIAREVSMVEDTP